MLGQDSCLGGGLTIGNKSIPGREDWWNIGNAFPSQIETQSINPSGKNSISPTIFFFIIIEHNTEMIFQNMNIYFLGWEDYDVNYILWEVQELLVTLKAVNQENWIPVCTFVAYSKLKYINDSEL